ncbi:MAG: hypothetical protein AAB492_03405 [Patescibacteria group bacterium]
MNERLPITFVTSADGNNKADIFSKWLPNHTITRRNPLYNEDRIHESAPHTEHRPQIIAERKAKDDIALAQALSGLARVIVEDGDMYTGGDEKMLLYTDTVQLVHINDTDIAMLEKPVGDPIEWAKHSPEAMMQSGKDVEIINALTGVRAGKDGVTEPVSVILHVRVSMRPFTRDEVVDFATKSPATVVATSGGLSIANGGRSFYDMTKPLVISVAESMDDKNPRELARYNTWDHVTNAELKPFICGAVEPAIDRLVEKTRPQKVV